MTIGDVFRSALCRRKRAVETLVAEEAEPSVGTWHDTKFSFFAAIAEIRVHGLFLSGDGSVELPMLPDRNGSPQIVKSKQGCSQ